MILQSLNALYDRLANDSDYLIAPPGWSIQKITFKVVLTRTGTLSAIEDARRNVDGKLRPRLLPVPGRTKSSGSGINPCFLWDNAQYVLGFKPDDANPQRTQDAFGAFRKKHLDVEEEIESQPFAAVCRFLESWDPAAAAAHPALGEWAKTGFGVFQIVGEPAYVHQDPGVRNWWNTQEAARPDGPEGQCLVTGETTSLARLHPKIKGVGGAQSAGATIVGFNEDAYESYGKSQSFNAPVSQEVATRYVKALNALLDGPMRSKHRLPLGSTTLVFWTSEPAATEDIFLQFMSEGSAVVDAESSQDEGLRRKLQAFLRALRVGTSAYADLESQADAKHFFLLGLAPNAARIAVRFFHEGSVAELLSALRRHHEDIEMVRSGPAGKRKGDPEFPPTWMLLRQTSRDPKDIPPLLEGPLLQAIVTGAPYPSGLFSAVIRRIGADRTINYPRACVIKGYLTRNLNKELTVSLDTTRSDPPYRLGRLFAALEKTQKDALGERLNKTIRDSFYSSASSAPVSVFPRLLRTYQHHLAKLDGGARVNREKLVQEILSPITAFPDHMSLPDQGLFAIGYYHQTRDFYTKRAEQPQS